MSKKRGSKTSSKNTPQSRDIKSLIDKAGEAFREFERPGLKELDFIEPDSTQNEGESAAEDTRVGTDEADSGEVGAGMEANFAASEQSEVVAAVDTELSDVERADESDKPVDGLETENAVEAEALETPDVLEARVECLETFEASDDTEVSEAYGGGADSPIGGPGGVEGSEESPAPAAELAGTELESFESAEIEDVEHLTPEEIRSVVESILFSNDKPLSIAVIKQSFKGTQVKSKDLRDALTAMAEEYAQSHRGFELHEVAGGFQLRTKAANIKYLRQAVKARPFKLSGPALEVLSIVAYKQPVTKAQIDEIRGVESGHLLRALMEKHLLTFGERSDLPGKPMYYETTKKFLEIFGLRNLAELPSLSDIDQLIPEGIGEVEDKETLGDLTDQLSQEVTSTYSVGEEELLKITDELSQISTSSEFFEQEKQRMRQRRDEERARNIREALDIGEPVDDKDRKWLERFDAAVAEQVQAESEVDFVTTDSIPDHAADAERELTAHDESGVLEISDHPVHEPEPGQEL
ncbi:MAG: SMC-Scp complex subunit ScpB [Bdellovibrionales bacterium]